MLEKEPISAVHIAPLSEVPTAGVSHSSATEPLVCLLCELLMCCIYLYLVVVCC